jgi:hypothetical protein
MLTSDNLQITSQAVGGVSLMGNVSTGAFRQLVPAQMREAVRVLKSLHRDRNYATFP